MRDWARRLTSGNLLLLALAVCGCEREFRIPDGPKVGASEPGRGDSLAKLQRLFLTADSPHAVAQAILCEHIRLADLYGPLTADTISRIVEDTVFRTRADKKAHERAENAVANHVFNDKCG